MTVVELNIYTEAYHEKLANEHNNRMEQAFCISRWVWAKQIDLNKYKIKESKKRNMSDEDMLKQARALNALFGGSVSTKE